MAKWVRFFGVSKSGNYEHFKHQDICRQNAISYKTEIKRIFDESGKTYGPDRICVVLRKNGRKASYRRVSRYKSEMNLQSVHNRHKTRSLTDSRNARGDGNENHIREKTFDRPNQALSSDITYLRCGEGWLHLCTVKDIVSGEILGESTSETMKKEPVIQAFANAQARHKLGHGVIFHSDRGNQYTSKEFMKIISAYGIKQSFSRVGMPGDNAWPESFFATLNKECIHFRQFATRDELRQTVFAWIEGFYNTNRVQARLGYKSPRAYAAMLNETPSAAAQHRSLPRCRLLYRLAQTPAQKTRQRLLQLVFIKNEQSFCI